MERNLLKFSTLISMVLCLLTLSASSQTCLNDDLSTPGLWTQDGTGVSVSNNKIVYNNAVCSENNRVYRTAPTYTTWKASFSFNPVSQGSIGGAGHIVFVYTAGTFHPEYSTGFGVNNNQDGIGVAWVSQPYGSKAKLSIWSKKGTIGNVATDGIDLPYGPTYYITLERKSQSSVVMHAYTDAQMTKEVTDSPKSLTIDCAITGLNTIQSAVSWAGSNKRILSANVSNIALCSTEDNPANCTVDGGITSEWTQVGTSVVVSGNKIVYNKSADNTDSRVYKAIPTYKTWKAEFAFNPITQGATGGAGHNIFLYTAGNLNPEYSTAFNVANTQDGIGASWISDPYGSQSPKLFIWSKKGKTYAGSAGITLPLNKTYYIRLARLNAATVSLHVFTDAAMLTEISGSPLTLKVDCSIANLTTIQSAVAWGGSYHRTLTAYVYDISVCPVAPSGCDTECPLVVTSVEENQLIDGLENDGVVYPNPSEGTFHVKGIDAGQITVRDVLGSVVYSTNTTVDLTSLNFGEALQPGAYFVTIVTKSSTTTVKVIKK